MSASLETLRGWICTYRCWSARGACPGVGDVVSDNAEGAAPTVAQVNALLGVSLYDAPSFRADVRIDFDEHGRILAASILNPGPRPTSPGDDKAREHVLQLDARCCVCGDPATRAVAARGLEATGQTLYCDPHAAELLARATRVTPPGKPPS